MWISRVGEMVACSRTDGYKIEALHAVGIDVADTVAHIGETVVKTLKEHGLYDKCHTC